MELVFSWRLCKTGSIAESAISPMYSMSLLVRRSEIIVLSNPGHHVHSYIAKARKINEGFDTYGSAWLQSFIA